jgi:phage tail protein X/CheY-like chemotaxis protein
MRISYRLVLPFIILMIFLLTDHALATRESTERLRFEKIAASHGKQKHYIVRKGDRLDQIIYSQYGKITYNQMKSIYGDIRQLNPQLRDPNRIYKGQILILPADLQGIVLKENVNATKYTARKGDSLTYILMREFGIQPQNVPAVIRQIRKLNPTLRNPDQIQPGQTLLFPNETPHTSTAAKTENSAVKETAEKSTEESTKAEQPPVQIQALPHIEAIRQIIRVLDGTLTSRGTYFLPLARGGQLTIDCTTVPVVELNDGSVILLDSGKKIPEKSRKIIRAGGKRYAIAALSNEEPIAISLQKIFGASRNYRMTRRTLPISIGENPQMLLRADWQVLHDKFPQKQAISIALNFLKEGEASLPAPVMAAGEKRGWKILEINEKTGAISSAEAKEEQGTLPVLSSGPAIELVASLLEHLGVPVTRDTDMQVFQKEKDGFNLDIRMDLAVYIQGRHILFNGKKIPQQFIDILKQRKFDVVILDVSLSKQGAIEKALVALSIPFANGDYSFPMMTTGRTRADVRFLAMKISASKDPWYLISFDLDSDLYHLIHRNGEINMVRY